MVAALQRIAQRHLRRVLILSDHLTCTYKASGLKCLKSEKQAMRDPDRESDRWANQVQHFEDRGNSAASLMGCNSLHSISTTVLQLFQFFPVLSQDTHTHTYTPSADPHPVPLSLLVEQNDDKLGVHLVSVLTERQITPLKRHIHQVPAERRNKGERVTDWKSVTWKPVFAKGSSKKFRFWKIRQ